MDFVREEATQYFGDSPELLGPFGRICCDSGDVCFPCELGVKYHPEVLVAGCWWDNVGCY